MSITPRSEKLDLRLTPAAKRMLYAAAAAERRSVSDFVLESALSRADSATAWSRRWRRAIRFKTKSSPAWRLR